MTKPTISSKFNVDDIRKIREYNAMRYENMSSDEIIADIKMGAENILKKMEEQKNTKNSIVESK